MADEFRAGRAFLVGDAARAISPLGAFGLNTGMVDAHNVAWCWPARRGPAAGQLPRGAPRDRRIGLRQALLRLENWNPSAAGTAPMVTMGYRYDSSAVLGPIVPIPSTEDIEASLDATPGSGFPNGDQSVYFGPCRIALHGLRRRGLVRGHPEGRCPRAVRTDDAGVLLVRPDGRSPATADAATLDDVQAAVTGCLPTPGS